ncbi:hypothetical protein DSLASN_43980 [Desulfoluna limicola]|uniref:Ice-binding protein C-terminal domain-containing protein n=1 Tax=Desulfoluna limicola TaxID=2810562 RepID=A0ABM7PNV1_9BACT|nr:PEP-CTERM sorting domain-containing protein [Desulfoluna limicola]BCS98766.1 hypothetical protein DSLASN_43980 [Desulfoluna limicola]
MKKIKNCLLPFIMAMGLLCFTGTGHAVSVHLDLSTSDICVGDTFELNVRATASESDSDILNFGFDVDDPADAFSLGTVTVNSYFDDYSSIFLTTDVAGVAFPSAFVPYGEDILLATLRFTALYEGSHSLGILSDNEVYEGIGWEWRDGIDWESIGCSMMVDVTDCPGPAPVPEPATMFLLGSGLLGLVGSRKKMKP